jgi:hypothetical protein
MEVPVSTTQNLHVFTGSVTVSYQSATWVYTEEETVEQVLNLINGLPLAQSVVTDANKSYDHSLQTTSTPTAYTIVLETADGEVVSYRLFGKTLTDLDTEEVFTLTDKEYRELLRLLELI